MRVRDRVFHPNANNKQVGEVFQVVANPLKLTKCTYFLTLQRPLLFFLLRRTTFSTSIEIHPSSLLYCFPIPEIVHCFVNPQDSVTFHLQYLPYHEAGVDKFRLSTSCQPALDSHSPTPAILLLSTFSTSRAQLHQPPSVL